MLHAVGRPLGRIASAPTTTPRSARSGAMASRRFPVIRPGSWRRLTGIPMEARSPKLAGISAAFTPDYEPEEIFEIANKLYTAFKS